MGPKHALSAAALLLACGSTAIAGPHNNEAKLAKAIEGRVAGKPVNCIQTTRIQSTRIIDKTAIIYDAGSTIYVNRPDSGASSLNQWNVLVTKPTSSQLCSNDVVHLYDSGTPNIQRGFVGLGKFVPYTSVKHR
jgi:hypothetical protein